MSGESLHVQRAAGVEMIISIDSTRRGPALGGCRWRPYPDRTTARLEAEGLARAMTRKAAMARLSLGGGKAVVMGDPRTRTHEQLVAFGQFVDSLGGRYVTGADMGTGQEAMLSIREGTEYVTGLPRRVGGCGDPGPYTAIGVRMALERACSHADLRLEGARVALQGAGSVGSALAADLLELGAEVRACDPDPEALAGLPDVVERVACDALLSSPCDVFAPCGPGGVIDRELAGALECRIVCGAANNPLVDAEVARELDRRGILYVPDFVANAGGLIHLAVALEGGDEAGTLRQLAVIPENLDAVLELAKAEQLDTAAAAERLARSLAA
jgi:leucine dehydrogenase